MKQESMVYMIALSKRKSISAAAAECSIAQSSFSSHLQRLEKSLGCTLFDRREGKLTPEGALYAAAAEDILRLHGAMEAELEGLARPTLRLGISEAVEQNLFSQVTAGFFEAEPKEKVHIDWDCMASMTDRLRQRELDLIFGTDPALEHSDIVYREVMTEQLFLVLPGKHPPVGGDPLGALCGLNFVILFQGSRLCQETERLLSSLKAQPAATLESNSYEVAHLLARDSACAAVIPASALPLFSGCVAVPLPGTWIGSGFCFLRQLCDEPRLRAAIRLFERAIRRIYGGLSHIRFVERGQADES